MFLKYFPSLARAGRAACNCCDERRAFEAAHESWARRGVYLGVCQPCNEMVQEVVPGGLAEATNPVSRLLEVITDDVLLATAIVAPLPLASQVLPSCCGLVTLHLIRVLNCGRPVVDLLVLLQGITTALLEIGLQIVTQYQDQRLWVSKIDISPIIQ